MHTETPLRRPYRFATRWPAGICLVAAVILCLLIGLMLPALASPARAGSRAGSPRARSLATEGNGVHRLGLQPSPSTGVPKAGLPQSYSPGDNLRASVDLSAQLPPVGDQGNQGSCVAWASSYYYKSWSEKKEHTSWNLNNPWYRYSPSFVYNQINGGVDAGASFYNAFTLLEESGDLDIAAMPYDDSDYLSQPTAAQKEAAKPYRIPGTWGALWNQYYDGPYSPPNNISKAKAWLDSGKMLVMALPIYSDFPDYYKGPSTYYDYDESSDMLGGHGVCICGYNDDADPDGPDEDHQGGFKMVNSWGSSWNKGGFVYLSYDFVKRYVWEAWTMGDLTNDRPHISSLSKSSGSAGNLIYIYGKNFGAERRNARVTFNGTTASNVAYVNSKVTAKVPSGATTGPLVVRDWEGTASNSFTFKVVKKAAKPSPTISSISPNTGTRGTTISITNLAGADFQPGSGTTVVKLQRSGSGDITATGVAVRSAGRITCRFQIPPRAPTGAWNLYVRNPDGRSATRGNVFMVRGATTTHPTSYPTWYLAEGTSNWGFSTYITIENPNRVPVSARITYMTPKVQVPGGTVNMPPESQVTVNPADTVGVTDFSTKVSCLEGKTICVDRTMSWTGTGAPAPEEHSSVGVNRPSRTWYLPEGSSKWGFETWLLIQNPNPTEATCTVTYMIEGGGQQKFTKRVPAKSRRTYNMADDVREADASIMVESDIPVIPERSMYRNNRREGHDSIGTTKPARDYFLAEGTTDWGFTTYVTVQNPNEQPAEVTVTYMREDGPQVQPPFPMPANSRKTIRVNDVPGMGSADFSTKVNGSLPIIAERSMYWNNGTGEACHDSVGTASAHGTFYLPDGQTSQGGETYTTVQNPNSVPVNVEITYMTPSGEGNVVFSDTIPARSRRTYNMADNGISGRAAVMVTSKTGGQGIICERAMYWGRRSAGTSTIGGYSN